MPNLLFTIADAEIDREKLESWRVATHEHTGGISLKDYVVSMLGGFAQRVSEKPECELIGQNGNIFNLMGIASRTLIRNGKREQAKEMCERITGGDCESYHEALSIIGEYVTITGPQEQEAQMGMQMKKDAAIKGKGRMDDKGETRNPERAVLVSGYGESG